MGGGGGLLGGVGTFLFGDGGASQQAAAAGQAANASLEATKLSLAQQKEMYDNNLALSKPMYDLGLSAAGQAFGGVDQNGQYYFDPSKLNQYSVNNPFSYQNFNPNQMGDYASQYQGQQFNPNIDVTQDPSYQFRLQQGVNALDKSAASRGMLLSGAQQKAVNNYAQDAASQQYQQAYQNALTANQANNQTNAQNFNNSLAQNNQQFNQGLGAYQQNQGNALTAYNSDVNLGNQRYNQLASVLGLGQTATNNLTQNNTNLANQYTNTQMQNAQNLGSAYAYQGNALANGQQYGTNALLKAGTAAAAFM